MEDTFDKDKEIDELLSDYDKLDYPVLASVVERLESTDAGKAVIEKNPDRKVYAVAKPTKQEYLRRFEAILKFDDRDGQEGELSLSYFRSILPAIKFCWCINLHYRNGAITLNAATDLQSRMWGIVPMDAPIVGWFPLGT